MNRIHTTCCALTASALVLAGMLLISLGRQTQANEAHASQVIARDNFTLMTAQTRSNEESLFVLDSTSGVLLVYRLDVSRESMEPVGGMRLSDIFEEPAGRRNRR
ncbi:MAG: hypothetical protein V3V20_07520 [Algisphaera sp.]